MLKSPLKKIAITGALGSGKTAACRFFSELSAKIVSADEIVHRLLESDVNIIHELTELFGSEIATVDSGGVTYLERAKIAEKAFQQPLLLQALEQRLHPAVHDEITKQYQQASADPTVSLFIAEIPLLFETGAEVDYDATIAVVAPWELCLIRFMAATGYGEAEYKLRMERQMGGDEKALRATHTIINVGSLVDLKISVKELYQELI